MCAVQHMQQLNERFHLPLQDILNQRLCRNLGEEGFDAEHDERLLDQRDFTGLAAMFMLLEVAQQLDGHHRIDRDHLGDTACTEFVLVFMQLGQIARSLLEHGKIRPGQEIDPTIQSCDVLLVA